MQSWEDVKIIRSAKHLRKTLPPEANAIISGAEVWVAQKGYLNLPAGKK